MLTWELLSLTYDIVVVFFIFGTKPLIVESFIVNNSETDVIN